MRKQLLLAALLVTAPRLADADCWHNVESGEEKNFSDPANACKDYIAKKYPNETGWTVWVDTTADPNIWRCTQVTELGSEFDIGVVTATPAQDHCYEMVNGPYGGLPIGYAFVFPGASYSTTQRTKIKEANMNKCGGRLASDFAAEAVQDLLWAAFGAVERCGKLTALAPVGDQPDCRPQIHHFIPKKDLNGCGCGANSSHNALVVSAYINSKMSNTPPTPELIDYVNRMKANVCQDPVLH